MRTSIDSAMQGRKPCQEQCWCNFWTASYLKVTLPQLRRATFPTSAPQMCGSWSWNTTRQLFDHIALSFPWCVCFGLPAGNPTVGSPTISQARGPRAQSPGDRKGHTLHPAQLCGLAPGIQNMIPFGRMKFMPVPRADGPNLVITGQKSNCLLVHRCCNPFSSSSCFARREKR
jgi:hypothetical protein